MNILDKIAVDSRIRAAQKKKIMPIISMNLNNSNKPFAFENALSKKDLSFICEVKKASPSKGIISETYPYLEIALGYEAGGADCISVLTEPESFLGSDSHLSEIAGKVSLPLLRKDFTVDEYQIYEAKHLGAGAILLICSILSETELKDFIMLAESLGMSALVETHNETEINSALKSGARLLGVNNRDLKTFETDFKRCASLRKMVPPEVLFIAESGVHTREDILFLECIGADAVLIGETLMRSPCPETALRTLRGTL